MAVITQASQYGLAGGRGIEPLVYVVYVFGPGFALGAGVPL